MGRPTNRQQRSGQAGVCKVWTSICLQTVGMGNNGNSDSRHTLHAFLYSTALHGQCATGHVHSPAAVRPIACVVIHRTGCCSLGGVQVAKTQRQLQQAGG